MKYNYRLLIINKFKLGSVYYLLTISHTCFPVHTCSTLSCTVYHSNSLSLSQNYQYLTLTLVSSNSLTYYLLLQLTFFVVEPSISDIDSCFMDPKLLSNVERQVLCDCLVCKSANIFQKVSIRTCRRHRKQYGRLNYIFSQFLFY